VAEGATAKGGEATEPTPAELTHARRVAESKATVPHAYFESEAADAWPAAPGELIVAAGLALRDFPRLNGTYRDAQFELHSRINIGVAMAAETGLVFPTIQDADKKAPEDVAAELTELGRRVGGGEITQPDLSGATFSLADLSPLGISRADLVVTRGQAAILAVGIRGDSVLTLSLACDNRIVQAPDAAGFLARLSEQLA